MRSCNSSKDQRLSSKPQYPSWRSHWIYRVSAASTVRSTSPETWCLCRGRLCRGLPQGQSCEAEDVIKGLLVSIQEISRTKQSWSNGVQDLLQALWRVQGKLDEEAKFQECGRRQWLPGQAVMVDYSGDGLPALIGSEHVELQIFVAVLPYSGYTFAYATPDQTRKSWLHSIREMMTSLQEQRNI